MDAATRITNLRQIREAAGMEVVELAYRAGVSQRTIERIEAGSVVPRKATLRVIYDVLQKQAAA